MSHTAPASASAPSHAPTHATQASARPTNAQGQSQRTHQTPADLFATLLALAADAAPVEGAGSEVLAGTSEGAETGDADEALKDNPLAGLLLWQPPAADTSTATQDPRAAATGHEAADAPALAPGEHAERRDGQALAAADAAPATPAAPANTARPQGPSWQVVATRAAQNNAPAHAAAGSDAPAMRWSRAAAPDAAAGSAPAWGVRSTVTMDPRFPASAHGAQATQALHAAHAAERASERADGITATGERAPMGAGLAAVAASGGTAQTDLSGQQAGTGEGGDSAATGSDAQAAQGDDAQQPYPGQEAEAVEVQHWGGAHGLRHASLRVGEEAGQAIDIQLALRGDEVQLDIRTDDSAARDALREQAQAALGERLQQGGLQLGNVSVGAQQQERQRDGQTATPLPAGRAQDARAEPAAAAPQAAARQAQGGLDLFI